MPGMQLLVSRSFLALSVLTLIGLTWTSAMTLPFMDGWRFVLWDQQNASGSLSLGSILLSHHNEHPYGIPGMLYILITKFTGHSFFALSMLSALAICGISCAIYSVSRKELTPILGATAAAIVCLSPRGIENQLYGFQIGFSLTVLFGVISIISARSEGKYSTIIMAISLIAGGFCSATFIATYIAAGFTVLAGSKSNKSTKGLCIIAILSAWSIYFLPSIMSSGAPHPSLIDRAHGLLILLGSPFFFDRVACSISGATTIAMFIYLAYRNRTGTLPYIGILSFLMIGTVAFGRGDFGGLNPSRYAVFGAPLIAVTLAMASRQWVSSSRYLVLFAAASVAAALPMALQQAKLARSQEGLAAAIIPQHESLSTLQLSPVIIADPKILTPIIEHFETTSASALTTQNNRPSKIQTVSSFESVNNNISKSEGKYIVSGRGHAYIRKSCKACAFRATLTNVSIANFISTEPANLGFLYLDRNKKIISNDSHQLEQQQSLATWFSYAPEDAAYVDIYVYSPEPSEKISFDSLSIERY